MNLRLHSGPRDPADPRGCLPARARMGYETNSPMSAPDSSAVTHLTNQPNQHACRYSPDPHWPSLSPDVVKWFNYDVLLPAGVECPYIIDSSSTLNGTHLPRIVLSRAERAPISTVTADQQAAAEPESVLHEDSSRGPKGDTKTLPSKGNRSSLPEPMHTGSNSWT